MPHLRALLSFLTFFGGHLLNRRLDRIIVMFAALAAIGIAAYLILPSLLFGVENIELATWAVRAPAALILATAVISAALTWLDARSPSGAPLTRSTMAAGVVVSIFGFLMLAVAAAASLSSFGGTSISTSTASATRQPRSTVRYPFYTSAQLGGTAAHPDAAAPPAGPHPLRGRIVLDGLPATNAEVKLFLNGTFETDALPTNDSGEFSVSLPAGRWFINRVTVSEWYAAPEGRTLLLFSEHEPALGPGYYSRHHFGRRTGLEVSLPAPRGAAVPSFELRDAIAVRWPARVAMPDLIDAKADLPRAEASASVIAWTPVPAAAQYEIQVSEIERKDGSMSAHTILRRRTGAAQLRLADLPQDPARAERPGEYTIEIFAFDSAGRLVSESGNRGGTLAFALTGATRLAKEPYVSTPTPSDKAEYFRNLERLSVISSLLDYQQFDAARAILSEVTGDAPPGRKLGLQGALEAVAGNCKTAKPLFDKADAEGGAGCAPLKYRRMCP